MTSARTLARRLGIGKLGYRFWHAPIGAIRRSAAEGGPWQQLTDRRGRAAMERAAATLSPQALPVATHLPELHFLTGERFWFQTAFCLHSLQHHAGSVFRTVLHDDGSLRPTAVIRLQMLFPAAQIRRRTDDDAEVAAHLPPSRFPCLHERRRVYPNILKLTDVHAGRQGWRLVLDSDMLFFRRPDQVLQWLAAPDRPLHLVDLDNAYGYSRRLMESLAGAPIPSRVNVGLTGLQSAALDWEQIEYWCGQLIASEGTHYYLEQALVAMLLAGRAATAAAESDYVVGPGPAQCVRPTAVLHHYVANSKRWYFRDTWRTCLSPS